MDKIKTGCRLRLWIALAGLLVTLTGCGKITFPTLDEQLSTSLRNLPPPAPGSFSEIRVYITSNSSFLESSELAKMSPAKALRTTSDIQGFFDVMNQPRPSSGDRAFRDLSYQPICYHIVAISADGTKYGYLKVQLSSNPDRPMAARVQVPDGTNSYEINTSLPDFLGRI